MTGRLLNELLIQRYKIYRGFHKWGYPQIHPFTEGCPITIDVLKGTTIYGNPPYIESHRKPIENPTFSGPFQQSKTRQDTSQPLFHFLNPSPSRGGLHIGRLDVGGSWGEMDGPLGILWGAASVDFGKWRKDHTHRIHGAGIYTNIGGILMVNVTIYSIHGSYGIWYRLEKGFLVEMEWHGLKWHEFGYPKKGCDNLILVRELLLDNGFQKNPVRISFGLRSCSPHKHTA